MHKSITSKKGFTIIEVVLVLAIAGLIFLMVFIALPALQRSQRDTQRSNDISRLSSALTQYQSNNRGAIPTLPETTGKTTVPGFLNASKADNALSKTDTSKTWKYFYYNYLVVDAAGETGDFADPDGHPYGLVVVTCDQSTQGNECTNADAAVSTKTFDDMLVDYDKSGTGKYHQVVIVGKATCSGEVAVANNNQRKVAILYKRENGGVICTNN